MPAAAPTAVSLGQRRSPHGSRDPAPSARAPLPSAGSLAPCIPVAFLSRDAGWARRNFSGTTTRRRRERAEPRFAEGSPEAPHGTQHPGAATRPPHPSPPPATTRVTGLRADTSASSAEPPPPRPLGAAAPPAAGGREPRGGGRGGGAAATGRSPSAPHRRRREALPAPGVREGERVAGERRRMLSEVRLRRRGSALG